MTSYDTVVPAYWLQKRLSSSHKTALSLLESTASNFESFNIHSLKDQSLKQTLRFSFSTTDAIDLLASLAHLQCSHHSRLGVTIADIMAAVSNKLTNLNANIFPFSIVSFSSFRFYLENQLVILISTLQYSSASRSCQNNINRFYNGDDSY